MKGAGVLKGEEKERGWEERGVQGFRWTPAVLGFIIGRYGLLKVDLANRGGGRVASLINLLYSDIEMKVRQAVR